ncbi:MAG: glycosyltransferase family 4 protein [Candidatus Methanofastidiosum sp.]|nr:glycosyltransferase family 4 protein [Methanofastidiosum sp.]
MKIAIVIDVIYPYSKGGMEKRLWDITNRLASEGHEIHIYCMKYWDGENVIINQGVYLHGVCKSLELYKNDKRSIKEALYFSIRLFFPLLKGDYEIIDCQNFPYFSCLTAKLVSLLKRKKLIITWHEVWDNYWYEYLGKKGVFGKIIEKFVSKITNYNIAVSELTKLNLEKIGCKGSIQIIPVGIEYDFISRVNPSENKSDIIFVGRLIEHKNLYLLLRSIYLLKKEIPNIKCNIVGDGPEKEKLIILANNLNLNNNVSFLAFIGEHTDLISLMKSSKVFVLPSSREGFGIVVLEANACGLPVVTSNHEMNAAKYLIYDYNGRVSKISENDFSKNILEIIHLKEENKKRCIEFAKKYDWSIITNKIINYYREVNHA